MNRTQKNVKKRFSVYKDKKKDSKHQKEYASSRNRYHVQ